MPAAVDDQELFRREAMGAFSHEIRTPLTSIRMVIELARREASGDSIVLDAELAAMLNTSVDDLQGLADDLQEASRVERGRVLMSRGPCDLRAACGAAGDLLAPRIRLAGHMPPAIEGPWDAPHLVRAIAGFAESANRAGDGTGSVRFRTAIEPRCVRLEFESGTPGGEPRRIAADAGFSFFRSRMFILAMGGQLSWQRSERYFSITADLPLD